MSDKTNMEQLLEWAETSQNFKEKISIIDKIKQFIEKEKQVKNYDSLDSVVVPKGTLKTFESLPKETKSYRKSSDAIVWKNK